MSTNRVTCVLAAMLGISALASCGQSSKDDGKTATDGMVVADGKILDFQASDRLLVDAEVKAKEGGADALSKDIASPPPAGDKCQSPVALTWSGGTASASGNTTNNTDAFHFADYACTGQKTIGADMFFSLPVTSGKTYEISVKPVLLYDPAVYVLESCNASTCLVGADADASAFEKVLFTAVTTGSVIIVLDSRHAVGSPGYKGAGAFSLSVVEYKGALGEYCSNPIPLAISGGSATVPGDTSSASNDLSFQGTCTSGWTSLTSGPDLFYSFSAAAGKSYKVAVMPSVSYDPVLLIFSSCSNLKTSCLAGINGGYAGTTETTTFTATTTGTYFIAVDSTKSTGGGYALEVTETNVPANDQCPGATSLTWTGNKASTSGSTSIATNQISFPYYYCTHYPQDGPDLFYKIAVQKDAVYKATVTPAANHNASIFLLSTCSTSTTACISGCDSSVVGEPDAVVWKAAANGDQIVVVDSNSVVPGSFTLDIIKYTPAAGEFCSSAIPITLVAGVGNASGDTTSASKDLMMERLGCVGNRTPSPDLFYSFNANAGKTYNVTVTPQSTYDPAIYVFTSCYTPLGSCVVGADSSISAGLAETVSFKATSSGTHYLGVDSTDAYNSSYGKGSFVISITEK